MLQETTDCFRCEIELSSIQYLVLWWVSVILSMKCFYHVKNYSTSNHSCDHNAMRMPIQGYNLARFCWFTCHLKSNPIRDTVWIYQVNRGSQWSETIVYSDFRARVYTQMFGGGGRTSPLWSGVVTIPDMFLSPAIACNSIHL